MVVPVRAALKHIVCRNTSIIEVLRLPEVLEWFCAAAELSTLFTQKPEC